MTPDERADLEQAYLLALMKRDAAIWHEHSKTFERGGGKADALSSLQAQKITPHAAVESPKKRKRSLIFYGRPCKSCGGTERYISNSNCVACHRTAMARSDAKRVAKRAESPASAGTKPNVPRLSQFKRLDTFRAGSAPRVPRRAARR